MEQNREPRNICKYICNLYDKAGISIQWDKDGLFANGVGITEQLILGVNKWSAIIKEKNSRWIKYLNMKTNNKKFNKY